MADRYNSSVTELSDNPVTVRVQSLYIRAIGTNSVIL